MILFADSCLLILIWGFEGETSFRRAAGAAINAVFADHPDALFAVSRLALLEVRVKPLRHGDTALLRHYDEFFAGGVDIVDISAAIIDRATDLCATHGLKTADAIHAASALSFHEPVIFLTGDQVFGRVAGLNARIVKPQARPKRSTS